MMKQVVLGLGLATTLAACGPATASKKTPPPANPLDTYQPIAAGDAQQGNGNGSTTLSGGTTTTTATGNNTAPVNVADTKVFALATVAGKTYESNCYRFGTTGDYSKKYWSFTATTMTSLLLKYSDENCTVVSKNTDGSNKVWSTWVIGSLTTKALTNNWLAVAGTCTKGCTDPYATAFRLAGTTLQEGSKVKDQELYNTDEGRYVNNTPSKTAVDLEALAAAASSGASTSTGSTTTTPATPAVPATGLEGLASLAGQTWSTCYVSKNTEAGVAVDRGFKRSLTFTKGATAAADTYRSDLTKYSNTDCTGDIVLPASASRTYGALVAKASATAGWIELDAQTCADNCKGVKALYMLPTATDGLKEAGEKTTALGTFYTDTPRIYKRESSVPANTAPATTSPVTTTPVATTPVTTPVNTTPVATTPVTTPPQAAPAATPTGFDLIESLAGQSWSTCYVSKSTEAGTTVDRGFKRTLTFIKGATPAEDAYRSDLARYTNTDCTGDVLLPASASRTYSGLVVKADPTAGWIEVDGTICAPNCKAVKSLMMLPADNVGLKEASEKTAAPGTFFVDTPRVYTLGQ